MHTVARLHSFDRAAKDAGLSEEEITDIIDFLAENPDAGDELAGTGGCRKIRVAGRGKGKRGGYRTITFYTGDTMPVFLVTVFGKGEKSTLTPSESAALKVLTKQIVHEYRNKVTTLDRQQQGKSA
ncbi:type II toxin-antitoxin system RelE/ParE family toxin [Bradyrhizobium sp. 157]|uniref:type II toxin-antitoxin system RelE/ParE family toxin n=1 Tax=Bradyrhizobium sp. 157 TaxID=2782631 RepID=UPI001FFA22C1|nr:type II toxin-antitoxin system RelE/ParE family toxin [Bradyrhizobium sp. 157]MCK1639578.1 type II toxin-antitoxin system RelE/ParE family toxin [Bradyrhizobium sp. 157]